MKTFSEERIRRDAGGRFDKKPQSPPETSLSTEPTVIVSPVSDREQNYWVRLTEGQTVTFDVSTDGLDQPGRPYTGDSLTLNGEGDKVRSEYVVEDEETWQALATALDELDPALADELVERIRYDISDHTGGAVWVNFDDGEVEFRHVARHHADSEGGVYTSNVMGSLEADPGYRYIREGWYLPAVTAALADYGYDS